jgi:hypothetical protein
MLPPATPIEKQLADLAPSTFRWPEKGRCHTSAAGRRRPALRRFGRELGANAFLLDYEVGFPESSVAAPLGDRMEGPREEGSGRAPNAAIPVAKLLHYIRCGESHRSTCCYPDLYAGAQGNPRRGYC